MTDRQTIENLLEEFYAARVRGDLAAIGNLFAESADFQIAGSDRASPLPVSVRGKPGILALMQNMISAFELSDFNVLEMLIDGDQAAVRWHATVYHTKSRQMFRTELADFITINAGKIASFIEFLDTALAAKVLAAR